MKFRKLWLSLLILLLILCWRNTAFAAAPEVASSAAILVETSTGKILYDKNIYDKMYPASTTKVMTAILALENCRLDEMATVSHNAIYSIPNGYVNANLREGEQMAVGDLLYALMVKSANDAAVVLAEHIGGSVEGFADKMNEKAAEIGCKNTHFVNPNGIHNDDHYSTAYDLSRMAAYGMQNETFRKYVSTVSYTLPATNLYPNHDRICMTTNDMLRSGSKYYNEHVIGIKTGYTNEAKNCLIAGAELNGTELISVVLHAGTNSEGLSERYVDTSSLFQYGFEDFAFSDVVKENSVVTNIEIENGNKDTKNLDLVAKDAINTYVQKDSNFEDLSPDIRLQEPLEAPITAGDMLGTATYTIDDIEYTIDLLASHDVVKKVPIEIFLIAGGIILLFFGMIILIVHHQRRKRRNQR